MRLTRDGTQRRYCVLIACLGVWSLIWPSRAELRERYWYSVHEEVSGHIGDGGDSRDVTEQIFLASWESLGNFDIRGNFRSWLGGITRNKVADYHDAAKS